MEPAFGSSRPAPTGVVYTLLLLLHVASTVVGFGALGLTGFQAARARHGPSGPRAGSVRRYFRPGINRAARVLYLVPVFGFALLAESGGAFHVSDAFVLSGLGMWVAATAVAEQVLWPAERRIQRVVTHDWRPDESLRRDCAKVVTATWFLILVFVAAVVIMVAKP